MCCINDVVLSHTGLWNRRVSSSPALRPCTLIAQWYVCLRILCLACWAPCSLHGVIACVCFCCLHLACGTCRWVASLYVARDFGFACLVAWRVSHLWSRASVRFGVRCVLHGGFPFVRSGVRPLRLSLRVARRVPICPLRCSSSPVFLVAPHLVHSSVPLTVHRQSTWLGVFTPVLA